MTQRIKGRGPAFLFDDITQRFPPVFTSQSGTVTNRDNLLAPQLSPKAEFTDSSSVVIEWPVTEDVEVDGYIIAGLDDPLSGLLVNAGPLSFRTAVKATQFSDALAIHTFQERQTFTPAEPPFLVIERQNVAAGKMRVGYVMPFKRIRDPSLSDAAFDFTFADTSQKERSQSGQTFSGSGVPFRTLQVRSAPTNSRTMYGIPEMGASVSFLGDDPQVSGTFQEIGSLTGVGRAWVPAVDSSITWPGVLVPGQQYLLRSFHVAQQGGADTGLSVAGQPDVPIARDDAATEFIAPANGDLQIKSGSTINSQGIELLDVSRLNQSGDPNTSIIAAVAASRASLPIAVVLSPDDPAWTRDTTIFGIPEWGVSTRTEAADDRFIFELRVTESL